MRYAIGGSPAVDAVGDELLVCDEAGKTVHRLTGEARRRFELVLKGEVVDLANDDVTSALEVAGLIAAVGEPAATSEFMSRRKVMAVGAAAAAAGVVTVALPSAVAAQSPGPGPSPSSSTSTSSSTTTTTPPDPPPPANISASQTGIEYPPGDSLDEIGIRWRRGSAASDFNYQATFSGEGITTFTVGGLTSSASYFIVSIPNWAVGVVLTVTFVTVGYSPNVTGQVRTTTRSEP